MDDGTAAKLNAVALSIAQSICRVIASSSLDRFGKSQANHPRQYCLCLTETSLATRAIPNLARNFSRSCSFRTSETECLQLMGAEDCDELVLSLQATLLTVLEASVSNTNMQTCKPPAHLDLVRRKIGEGDFVEAYSRLDKLLDDMASALAEGQGFSI